MAERRVNLVGLASALNGLREIQKPIHRALPAMQGLMHALVFFAGIAQPSDHDVKRLLKLADVGIDRRRNWPALKLSPDHALHPVPKGPQSASRAVDGQDDQR